MTDNIKVNPSSEQESVSVATDNIDNVHYPVYKMAIGDDGEADLIDKSNRVPVQLPDITHETDTVILLNEISKKLSILIKYEAMLHKVDLEENS